MSEDAPIRSGRRATDPPASAPGAEPRGGLPAATGSARAEAEAVRPKTPAEAAFEAQLMTQGSVKRGLRGGKEVLDAARTTYLKTEWSGPKDRRPPQGALTRTKV